MSVPVEPSVLSAFGWHLTWRREPPKCVPAEWRLGRCGDLQHGGEPGPSLGRPALSSWPWGSGLLMFSWLVALLIATCPGRGIAAEPTLTAEQEVTARRIEEQLMAPCCFGSTVATHYSPAADAIRRDVRALVAHGATEQEILAEYLDRYGERILAQPVVRGFNVLAYAVPVAAWLCGTAVVVRWCRRRRRTVASSSATRIGEPIDTLRWGHQMEKDLAAFDA